MLLLLKTEEAWRWFIGGLKPRGHSGVEVATNEAAEFALHDEIARGLPEAFPP